MRAAGSKQDAGRFPSRISVENASIGAFGSRESVIATLARIAGIFNEMGAVSAGFWTPADPRRLVMFKASFRCEVYAETIALIQIPLQKLTKQLSAIAGTKSQARRNQEQNAPPRAHKNMP